MSVPTRISRIDTFDLLRGYFLIVILWNHLYYYPSGLELVTGRGWLYVSSAEGFFLISGIILGIVRGQKLLNKPWSVGAKLLLRRALQLYVTSVVLALLFTVIGWQYLDNPGLKAVIAPPDTPLWTLIWNAATYQYLYGWADFLRQYALFIAVAPLALWLLRRGWWYVVLLASVAVWALFPFVSLTPFMAQPVSWQLIFFSGLVIGFHWPWLQDRWRMLAVSQRRRIGYALVTVFISTAIMSALLVFNRYIGGDAGAMLADWHRTLGGYFDKDRLPLARLALGAVWFWALFWLVRRHEAWLVKKLGWLLLPLGQNSLYVYTVQAFIVFFMHLYVQRPTLGPTPDGFWLTNLLYAIAALVLSWWMVRRKILFKIIPR